MSAMEDKIKKLRDVCLEADKTGYTPCKGKCCDNELSLAEGRLLRWFGKCLNEILSEENN
jgi:hypothetical protein